MEDKTAKIESRRVRLVHKLAEWVGSNPLGKLLDDQVSKWMGISSDTEITSRPLTAEENLAIETALKRQANDILFLFCAGLALIWMGLSYSFDVNGFETNMFPRSGAVLVAVALISEFGALQSTLTLPDDSIAQRAHDFHKKLVKPFVIFCIGFGTLVWAYGDLVRIALG